MGTCPSAIGAIAGNITKNNKSRMIPFSNGHLAEAQILLGLKEEYKFRWIFPQGPGNGKKIRGRIQLEYHTCRRTTNLGSIGKSCLEGARGISGGEGGIRTPGTSFGSYNGLANRRIQPLCHLSGVYFE